MNVSAKKLMIKKLVNDTIIESTTVMRDQLIDKVLKSGCIDIESWEPNINPMVLVKSITIALFNYEADQFSGKGTAFEKIVKKESKNIYSFL